MCNSRTWRWAALTAAFVLLGLVLALSFWEANTTCMGVRILSQDRLEEYTQSIDADLSADLTHGGEPAAVDQKQSIIYISQNISEQTKCSDLFGKLQLRTSEYQLYFAPDPAFDDLAAAAQDGHVFRLFAVDKSNAYMEYGVIFTTLPVLRLDGAFSYTNEEWRDVLSGSICLWSPIDPELGRYSVKSSALEWHIRGDTAATLAKTPWKLSLKNASGENNDLSFLGLGADDDWILNSLALDDTKIKEKLFMDLWNELAAQTSYNYSMSHGEFVEVVINGEYSGIYLLQRRVDGKLLELKQEDILLKGDGSYEPVSIDESYEIRTSPLSSDETLAIMEGFWSTADATITEPDNFTDVNLFLQFAAAIDNSGYKNMLYVLRYQDGAYMLHMVPWDTDMSFGVTWNEGFVHDLEYAVYCDAGRQELGTALEQIPQLYSKFPERWIQLRQTLLTEDHIASYISKYEAVLHCSAALARDQALYGLYYDGDDSMDNLHRFLEERLLWLDEFYAEIW